MESQVVFARREDIRCSSARAKEKKIPHRKSNATPEKDKQEKPHAAETLGENNQTAIHQKDYLDLGGFVYDPDCEIARQTLKNPPNIIFLMTDQQRPCLLVIIVRMRTHQQESRTRSAPHL